jgi:hypothetical protein
VILDFALAPTIVIRRTASAESLALRSDSTASAGIRNNV